MEPVTEQDIRKIMTHYGESLDDLGAEYGDDFLNWFKEVHPETYKKWYDKWSKIEDPIDGDCFIFNFSNDSLDGLIYKKHDKILAEFCNENKYANRHIHELLREC